MKLALLMSMLDNLMHGRQIIFQLFICFFICCSVFLYVSLADLETATVASYSVTLYKRIHLVMKTRRIVSLESSLYLIRVQFIVRTNFTRTKNAFIGYITCYMYV